MDEFVKIINNSVVWFCQLSAILVITVGIIKSLTIYIKDALFGADSPAAIQESRLELGHSFSLGLGFLIGGSILKTTLAPTWNDIGQLSAIIAIRTILNYFLLKNIDADLLKAASSGKKRGWASALRRREKVVSQAGEEGKS
jgi:uncharacterized membrane protein